ncbi:C39 family peptidase [Acetivibrio cellulolyticus]|uniref:C39 family peptidase n=1 Tax=Acetivibrio cellulolyticus TaxID=35830 RepID=UPI0001E2BA51|nr:C39 family peptidase [Acetivibrio cellulolyticus]
MKTKLISVLLVICVLCSSLGVMAFAKDGAITDNVITKDDAYKIALLFVADTIKSDSTSKWTKDTKLKSVDETVDIDGSVNSYCFNLEQNELPNGYLVVSANSDLGIILEQSDEGEPLYKKADIDYDKVVYTSPLEYHVTKGKDTYEFQPNKKLAKVNKKDLKDNFNHKRSDKAHNKDTVQSIKTSFVENARDLWMESTYKGQVDGYAVDSDVYSYVNDRYGKGWTLKTSKTVSSAGSALLMNNFRPGVGCCTITALTYVFDYHRRNSSKSKIPSDINTLFSDIENIAVNYGYDKKTGGTNPLDIDNIVKDVWKKYGYTGSGSSLYVFTRGNFTYEIDKNRPALLNISFGYYGNHTVSMVGYRRYTKKNILGGESEILFLKVYDNWTTDTRYIDYDAITNPLSGDFSTLSLSRIYP